MNKSVLRLAAAWFGAMIVSVLVVSQSVATIAYIDSNAIEFPAAKQKISKSLGSQGSVLGVMTGKQWYVATNGTSSGDGSLSKPWDLQTALSHPATVKPGDVIWIKGGSYGNASTQYKSTLAGSKDSPIVVRQYPGERAIIDGRLFVWGPYTWYWGFEIGHSVRNDGADCLDTYENSHGTKYINLVIHDCGSNGIGFWRWAEDAEIYGTIIYHNGFQGSDRGHGHGIYTQNEGINGGKTIEDNIIFKGFNLGIQGYGSQSAYLRNYKIKGNIIFEPGVLQRGGNRVDAILMTVGSGARDIVVEENYTYQKPSTNDGYSRMGWVFGSFEENLVAKNNYWMGGESSIELWYWNSATFTGNVAYSRNMLTTSINTLPHQSLSNYNIGNNTYYGSNLFRYNGGNRSLAGMQSLGIENGSTYAGSAPTGVWTFVRPNKYEPGRANVAIYNWDLKTSVEVDFSASGMKVGDKYIIKDVQNYFGAPIVSGTYAGGKITVPMTNTAIATPVGSVPTPAVHTGLEFGAFVLLSGDAISGSGGNTSPPSGTTPPPSNQKPEGYLDGVTSDGVVSGWAHDKDDLSKPVTVHLYFDKNAGTSGATPIAVTANQARSDVGNHAFNYSIPASLRDGKSHQVWAWAIDLTDTTGASNIQLIGSPKSFTITQPPVTNGTVSGELKQWHKVTVAFDGPATSESSSANPFTDYRLNVTFTKGSKSYTVPGYYAADGNAGETSSLSGSKWKVHFMPDETGTWTYTASFRTGSNVAVSTDAGAGTPAGFNGATGTFNVSSSDKTGADFRGKGLLQYVGERYLRFAGTGEYFIKTGPGSPENFLAFADFDQTTATHRYVPHAGDWKAGDPVWQGSKGKNIVGALNYLNSKGMNSLYFLTMNVGGDGKDVWPWTSSAERLRFDVSKLDQWETVFSHMTKLGIQMHVITQETENNHLLDGGALGNQRKLYYRELVARFGHHPAVVWNLGEENTNSDAQRKEFANYIRGLDAYRHPIVVHNHPTQDTLIYTPLLNFTNFEGPSMQVGHYEQTRNQVLNWINKSKGTSKPWVVSVDEVGPVNIGVAPDSVDLNHDAFRKQALWATLTAGGAGTEWLFGMSYPNGDINLEDFRSRDRWWDQNRYAAEFFRQHLPFTAMSAQDSLTSRSDDYVFAEVGKTYVVYFPSGGSANLNLGNDNGQYSVKWYNPRSGGALQNGSITAVTANGSTVSLGTAPSEQSQDWAVLLKRTGTGTTPPPVDTTFPTVNITVPAAGSTVSGTISINANASDNIGVSRVEFFVDGALKGTSPSTTSTGSGQASSGQTNFSFVWDTTGGGSHPCSGAHTHSLTVKAYDAAGNVTTGSTVTVNMNNPSYCATTPPAASQKPEGHLDGVNSDGIVSGWAHDNDNLSQPVTIHLYFDKNAGTSGATPIAVTANQARSDVGNHAFNYSIPASLRDGKSHQVWAWAIDLTDTTGASNIQLIGSPKSFTLGAVTSPPPVDNTVKSYLYVEAETGSLSGTVKKGIDSLASGSTYIYTDVANSGAADIPFTVPSAGEYVIWARVQAKDFTADSYFVSVDGGAEDIYDAVQERYSTDWQWEKINGRGGGMAASINPRVFTLSAGSHTLNLKGRDAYTLLDKLLITNDVSFVPSGLGGPVSVPNAAVTPAITPNGGTFTGSVSVSLSTATTGATIRYTTNGSEPATSSAIYSAPITLTSNTTVKAKAFKSGMTDSVTSSASFTVNAAPVLDIQAPTVSISSPANSQTVSGTIVVSASASDNVGVVGVQFKLNGSNLGIEDLSAPYSATLNTASYGNGSHVLTAAARDAAGNTRVSSPITFTINNVAADTTPPTRSSGSPVGQLAAGTSSTTVSLSTNESATCRFASLANVAYGSMSGVFSQTGGTSHSVQVTGLGNGSTYTYYIRCKDAVGNENTNDYTVSFSVSSPLPPAGGDTTAPIVSSVSSSQITTSSAVITWTTNELSNTQVEYGASAGYGASTPLAASLTLSHSVTLTNLSAGALYNFRVKSRDAAGNLALSSNFNFTTIAATPPVAGTNQPVGKWTFEPSEISGSTITDASGNAITGTIARGVTAGSGRVGQGLLFNGVDGYVSFANDSLTDSTGDLTVMAWIKTSNSSRTEAIVTKLDAGGQESGYLLKTNFNGTIGLRLGGLNSPAQRDFNDSTVVNDNQWHHVAAVVTLGQTGGVKIYVDGKLTSSHQAVLYSYSSRVNMQLGMNGWLAYGNYFTGGMDDVRIYRQALSDSDIAGVYQEAAGNTPPVQQNAAVPVISPGSGTHIAPVTVSMSSATSGVTIRYTTNGSEPTSSSPVYTSPLTLSTPGVVVVKARAFRSGYTDSAAATATYTVQTAPVPANPPVLVVTAPAAGGQLSGSTVTVNYAKSGDLSGVNHAVFRLNNGAEVRDLDFDGTYLFSNVPAGSHVLTGYLAKSDNTKIANTDVTVSFTVLNPVPNKPVQTVRFTAEGSGSQALQGKLIILSSDNRTIGEIDFNADSQGQASLTMPDSLPIRVTVRVSVPGYLSKVIANVDPAAVNTLDFTELLAGDLNGDNIINSLDYSIANRSWNDQHILADLNKDGVVNHLDMQMLVKNWNRRGE